MGAATSDIAKKASLQDVVIEIELFDSVTNERLVAIIDSRGNDKNDPTSWDELEMIFARYGRVMQCRLPHHRPDGRDRGRRECRIRYLRSLHATVAARHSSPTLPAWILHSGGIEISTAQ